MKRSLYTVICLLMSIGAAAGAETLPSVEGHVVLHSPKSADPVPQLGDYDLTARVMAACATLTEQTVPVGADGSYRIPALTYDYANRPRLNREPRDQDEFECIQHQDDAVIQMTLTLTKRSQSQIAMSTAINFPFNQVPSLAALQSQFGLVHFTKSMTPASFRVNWGGGTLGQYVQNAIAANPSLVKAMKAHDTVLWRLEGPFAMKSSYAGIERITDFGPNCHKVEFFDKDAWLPEMTFKEAPGSRCGVYAGPANASLTGLKFRIGDRSESDFVSNASFLQERIKKSMWFDFPIASSHADLKVRIVVYDPSITNGTITSIGSIIVGEMSMEPLPANVNEFAVNLESPRAAKLEFVMEEGFNRKTHSWCNNNKAGMECAN